MQEQQLQLVNYEQAKKLKSKEIGFDWVCKTHFRKGWNELNGVPFICDGCPYRNCAECIPAPTVALALKWFRDVKGVFTGIYNNNMVYCDLEFDYVGIILFDEKMIFTKHYATYEEAESASLDALIEHCLKEVRDEKI